MAALANKPGSHLLRVAAQEEAPKTLAEIRAAVDHCRACPLWRNATQGVAGAGPARAPLVLVGEQPGDQEDMVGKPFVGPAGKLLDRALAEAGVDRAAVYVTNAVKHFKYEQRGKRRIHQKPNAGEIKVCRWWLAHELALAKPKLVLAMGATAVRSVFGRPLAVTKLRGAVTQTPEGWRAMATIHPSFLLRVPDAETKARDYAAFVRDLKAARKAALAT